MESTFSGTLALPAGAIILLTGLRRRFTVPVDTFFPPAMIK